MSKFEIKDPELRRLLHGQIDQMRLLDEDSYASARTIHRYITDRREAGMYLPAGARPYFDCFGRFLNDSVKAYAPKHPAYIDSTVLLIASFQRHPDLADSERARVIYACGNLFEMNRILIDIANAMHHKDDTLYMMDI